MLPHFPSGSGLVGDSLQQNTQGQRVPVIITTLHYFTCALTLQISLCLQVADALRREVCTLRAPGQMQSNEQEQRSA